METMQTPEATKTAPVDAPSPPTAAVTGVEVEVVFAVDAAISGTGLEGNGSFQAGAHVRQAVASF